MKENKTSSIYYGSKKKKKKKKIKAIRIINFLSELFVATDKNYS